LLRLLGQVGIPGKFAQALLTFAVRGERLVIASHLIEQPALFQPSPGPSAACPSATRSSSASAVGASRIRPSTTARVSSRLGLSG